MTFEIEILLAGQCLTNRWMLPKFPYTLDTLKYCNENVDKFAWAILEDGHISVKGKWRSRALARSVKTLSLNLPLAAIQGNKYYSCYYYCY